jgi:hypothetical protein
VAQSFFPFASQPETYFPWPISALRDLLAQGPFCQFQPQQLLAQQACQPSALETLNRIRVPEVKA